MSTQPTRGVVIVPKVDVIFIDSMLEETHTLTSTVTDHPVEDGYNISDHVRPDPVQVTLRCFVSNTPLSADEQSRAVQSGAYKYQTTQLQDAPIGQVNSLGSQAYEKLKQLHLQAKLVQVVTTLQTYEASSTSGMVIQSITIPRTRDNFDGLEFSLTLKEIRIVQNRATTDTKQKVKKSRPVDAKGSKPTTPAGNDDSLLKKANDNKDGLTAGLKSLGGAIGGGG